MAEVSRGEDGVLEPRLRLGGVALRGAAYGVGAAVCVGGAAFVFQEHDDRVDFLEATTFLALLTGAVCLLTGLFFWASSSGEVLRWRDFFTTSSPHDVVSIVAPWLVRAGTFLLVPVPFAYGLSELVASATVGSWLWGGA
ncbi:hypothetical protein DSC45_32335 [Streptomyces sp. YIM 130001]|uniref:DUF6336 family protein n=1 Tax=Streptomyces sp. YIM 130001 TaxID=2259644 RepID=UPI000E650FEB|nr:DUF6336 family protein [Streptomyces sp. YIM 130001]RII09215.1 hypothetical protein DSC45_32335 [Streptomyces sp. YIM 130001]